jgi:hypothetical protein
MSPEEKAVYLDQIKDLRKKQKKEKENRINKYLDIGNNILCLKFTNESLSKDNKKAYEIETLYNLKEIEAAKFCIKNDLSFPPEHYFENTFIPKLTKDEETGEINFWTKNFYRRLLRGYFKEEEKKISEKEEKEKEEKEGKEGKEEKVEEKEEKEEKDEKEKEEKEEKEINEKNCNKENIEENNRTDDDSSKLSDKNSYDDETNINIAVIKN